MSEQPKDGSGYLSRGMRHMREGRWAEGKADFEQALKLELDRDVPPNERGIHYDRPEEANCHLQLGAAHVELGDLVAAEAEMELGMKLDPREPSFTARGAVRLLRGNLPGAFSDLERALELDPRSLRAHRHRATYFEKLGDPARAIAELEHALVGDPLAEPERTRWLELRKQQGKSGEPREVLPAPQDAQQRYLRGFALAQHEEYAAAIDDYTYALANSKALLHAYLNRGVAFSMLGKLEEALADFKSYEAKFPEQFVGAYYQGWALVRAGQNAAAIPEYERALQLSPEDRMGIKKTLEELRAPTPPETP